MGSDWAATVRHMGRGDDVAPRGGHVAQGPPAARARRLTDTTRRSEPNGWCQKKEGDALNLALPFAAREREEMAGGKDGALSVTRFQQRPSRVGACTRYLATVRCRRWRQRRWRTFNRGSITGGESFGQSSLS